LVVIRLARTGFLRRAIVLIGVLTGICFLVACRTLATTRCACRTLATTRGACLVVVCFVTTTEWLRRKATVGRRFMPLRLLVRDEDFWGTLDLDIDWDLNLSLDLDFDLDWDGC